MSSTNRIIIPVVGSRQNLQEQNVFKHVNLVLTPKKDQHRQQSLLWKKSLSAFKKFKQKRERKDKKQEMSMEVPEDHDLQKKKSYFKLVQKRGRFAYYRYGQLLQNEEFHSFLAQPSNKYYDPTQAPLFMSNEIDSSIIMTQVQQKIALPIEVAEVNIPEICVKKQESEVMEEQFPMVIAIEPMQDDPFIIIRKTTSKKSSKSTKSKLIKKESKIERVKSKESVYSNSQMQKYSAVKRQNADSDFENSPDKYDKCNKQIMTFQQIIKEASQKEYQEQIKKVKLKEPQQSFKCQKQSNSKHHID